MDAHGLPYGDGEQEASSKQGDFCYLQIRPLLHYGSTQIFAGSLVGWPKGTWQGQQGHRMLAVILSTITTFCSYPTCLLVEQSKKRVTPRAGWPGEVGGVRICPCPRAPQSHFRPLQDTRTCAYYITGAGPSSPRWQTSFALWWAPTASHLG